MSRLNAQKTEEKSREIENFLYFVFITIIFIIAPYLFEIKDSLQDNVLINTVLGLSIAIILVLLVETFTKYLKRKEIFLKYRGSLVPLYIIYIAIYLVVRIIFDI